MTKTKQRLFTKLILSNERQNKNKNKKSQQTKSKNEIKNRLCQYLYKKNERRISNLDDQIQQMLKKIFDFNKQKLLKNEKLCQTKRKNSNVKNKKRVKNKERVDRQK